jgi:NADPH:quinone reductase-like Zn-dependent oxidoreductase
MKAICLTKYGGPEVLQLEEVDRPEPKENEVLVKIYAAAINDYDWCLMRGKPYFYRLLFGLLKPKNRIPGMEMSGIIAARGKNATQFEVGDAVYGDISEFGFGTFAEYLCINEKALTPKPAAMSFPEAAATPHAATLALQGLVDIGNIQSKQKILINGAGGGVGTFALAIAKLYNAEVTGVDTGAKLTTMKAIGFDHVIDYKKNDFTRSNQQYDLILDTKTCRPIGDYLRALSPKGRYVTVGGHLKRLLQTLALKPFISLFSQKSVDILALKTNKDLEYINTLFNDGKIKPIIDGPYALHEVPKLIQYFGEGKHTGKVVISLETPII